VSKITCPNSVSIQNDCFYVNVDLSAQESESVVASALSVNMSSDMGSSLIDAPNVTKTHLLLRPQVQLNAHATFCCTNNNSKEFHISFNCYISKQRMHTILLESKYYKSCLTLPACSYTHTKVKQLFFLQ